MLSTYRAILRGDRVEWIDAPPDGEHPTPVHVTLLDEVHDLSPHERGRAMAQILEELSRGSPLAGIPDPVAWQREVRRDRDLDGREP
jgi:hypothetical protein